MVSIIPYNKVLLQTYLETIKLIYPTSFSSQKSNCTPPDHKTGFVCREIEKIIRNLVYV
jgi:hypothetical protein